ncbi:MAG: DNA helicase, partial [Sphaerospermopsis kisseleviana]
HQEFEKQVQLWETCITHLDDLNSSLDAFSVFENIQESLKEELVKINKTSKNSLQKLEKAKIKLNEIEEKLKSHISNDLIIEKNCCEMTWQQIPDQFKPQPKTTETDFLNLEFLQQIKQQFDLWQQQLQNEE